MEGGGKVCGRTMRRREWNVADTRDDDFDCPSQLRGVHKGPVTQLFLSVRPKIHHSWSRTLPVTSSWGENQQPTILRHAGGFEEVFDEISDRDVW